MASLRIRLGRAIRGLRTAAGYSQEKFAVVAGVHRTYMSILERGAANPGLDTVERVAEALGKRASELIRIAENDRSAGAPALRVAERSPRRKGQGPA